MDEDVFELVSRLPYGAQAIIRLAIMALQRGDRALVEGLAELCDLPAGGDCTLSKETLERVGAVCNRAEAIEWGAALASAIGQGDGFRAGRLQELMRRRACH